MGGDTLPLCSIVLDGHVAQAALDVVVDGIAYYHGLDVLMVGYLRKYSRIMVLPSPRMVRSALMRSRVG